MDERTSKDVVERIIGLYKWKLYGKEILNFINAYSIDYEEKERKRKNGEPKFFLRNLLQVGCAKCKVIEIKFTVIKIVTLSLQEK